MRAGVDDGRPTAAGAVGTSSSARLPSGCLACGDPRRRRLHDLLWQCPACGFAWADEREAVDPGELYDDGYFFGGEYLDYPAERRALELNFAALLRRLRRYVPGGRLLEVGCAYGFFLRLAGEHFTAMGVDVNRRAVEHARTELGVDARCGTLEELDFETGSFDVVVSIATIEHLARPDRLVERAAALLRPGGVFACTTPDLSSLVARMRGRRWRMIHPPTHISYFTRPAMARLLGSCGLEPVRIEALGQHRTVDNVLYTILCLQGRAPRLYPALQRLGLTRGRFYLNTFDTMLAVGVRQ